MDSRVMSIVQYYHHDDHLYSHYQLVEGFHQIMVGLWLSVLDSGDGGTPVLATSAVSSWFSNEEHGFRQSK